MQKLSTYLFLIFFTLQTPSWADDIRNYEIEGMSIGDSLLDYFSKEEINKYKQNYLCHGDLHFKNIIHHKNAIYFIDLDYVCVSAKGYDIAMLVYQERVSKKEIKEISKKLQINHYEILHYIPICYLLDYLWQEILIELKYIKKNNVEKKVIKNFLKNIS